MLVRLCECGCGQPTPIAKLTNARWGHVKGQPVRFVLGHSIRPGGAPPLLERYVVDESTGCWLWTGPLTKGGYGTTSRGVLAHRAFYKRLVGRVEAGLHLHHMCHTPACVNPAHMEVLPNSEHQRLHKRERTHCKNGHALTADNIYGAPGQRLCVACRAGRRARRAQRRAAA